jgi:ArsR family transcriptional regulator
MNKTQRQKLSAYMKALGHPVRVQIIEILARKGECISGDLSSQLPVAASTTSQHLAILKDAGLITGTIDGPRRCYCTNPQAFDDARSLLANLHDCC